MKASHRWQPAKVGKAQSSKGCRRSCGRQIAEGYEQTGNKPALVRLIGSSINDFGDYSEADAGEPPKGAKWN